MLRLGLKKGKEKGNKVRQSEDLGFCSFELIKICRRKMKQSFKRKATPHSRTIITLPSNHSFLDGIIYHRPLVYIPSLMNAI